MISIYELRHNKDDFTLYAIPEAFKDLKHHDQLFALAAPAAAKRPELKARWKTRASKVILKEDLAKCHIDDVGNPILNGTVMDELEDDGHKSAPPSTTSTPVITENSFYSVDFLVRN